MDSNSKALEEGFEKEVSTPKKKNGKDQGIDLENINSFYIFSSKPKAIPLIKKITGFLFFGSFLLWYLVLFISFIVIQNFFIERQADAQYVNGGSIIKVNAIIAGWLKHKMLLSVWFLLPVAMIYILMRSLKKEKYENSIYNISVFYLVVQTCYFFILLFFIFKDDSFIKIIDKSKNQYNFPWLDSKNIEFAKEADFFKSPFYIAEKVVKWFVASVIFINIGIFVFAFLLKPKVDRERLFFLQNEIRKKTEAALKERFLKNQK